MIRWTFREPHFQIVWTALQPCASQVDQAATYKPHEGHTHCTNGAMHYSLVLSMTISAQLTIRIATL